MPIIEPSYLYSYLSDHRTFPRETSLFLYSRLRPKGRCTDHFTILSTPKIDQSGGKYQTRNSIVQAWYLYVQVEAPKKDGEAKQRRKRNTENRVLSENPVLILPQLQPLLIQVIPVENPVQIRSAAR